MEPAADAQIRPSREASCAGVLERSQGEGQTGRPGGAVCADGEEERRMQKGSARRREHQGDVRPAESARDPDLDSEKKRRPRW